MSFGLEKSLVFGFCALPNVNNLLILVEIMGRSITITSGTVSAETAVE
jgi:hypothetical protein